MNEKLLIALFLSPTFYLTPSSILLQIEALYPKSYSLTTYVTSIYCPTLCYNLFFEINNLLYRVQWQSVPTKDYLWCINPNLTYTVSQHEGLLGN